MYIREKKHRLPRECCRGEISVAFTFCLEQRRAVFTEPGIESTFVMMLDDVANKLKCMVPVYCFMPDHQHIIFTGRSASADVWKAAVLYKQKTGFWLSKNQPAVRWQKDFFDHVIRKDQSLATRVRYILDNPVGKGISKIWKDYPYKGSAGCNLEDILAGIM